MDKKDIVLLQELSRNARIPLNELAKKIRMSKSSTFYRIERLERDKILLGTNTIINAYRLGYEGFRTNITLRQVSSEMENELINWLVSRHETSVVGKTKNSAEIFFMSWISSTKLFYQFIQEFKERYGLNLKELQIHSYVGTVHYPRNYLNKDASIKEIFVRIEQKEKYDKIDLAILKKISFDARKSALSIANELDISVRTIINRIKALERKKIIQGYSANIDIKKIGYEYYKLNIVFSKSTNYSTLLAVARGLLHVVYVDETISRYDLEINIEVKNEGQLQQIVNQLKDLAGGFESIEMKQLDQYYKLGFLS